MSEDVGFIGEKQLLARLPISRRTLGNWKATSILPYIKIGRRCLYDWASVQGALLHRQKADNDFYSAALLTASEIMLPALLAGLTLNHFSASAFVASPL